jgi:hypothetical protein
MAQTQKRPDPHCSRLEPSALQHIDKKDFGYVRTLLAGSEAAFPRAARQSW